MLHIYGTGTKIKNITGVHEESLGLNVFPLHFPDVKYWLWLDNINFGHCIYEKTDSTLKPYFPFTPGRDIKGSCSSATYAISWAIKEGYKKVNLYGILDEDEYNIIEVKGVKYVEWRHFYDDTVLTYRLSAFETFNRIVGEQKQLIDITFPLKKG